MKLGLIATLVVLGVGHPSSHATDIIPTYFSNVTLVSVTLKRPILNEFGQIPFTVLNIEKVTSSSILASHHSLGHCGLTWNIAIE